MRTGYVNEINCFFVMVSSDGTTKTRRNWISEKTLLKIIIHFLCHVPALPLPL